MYPIRLFAIAAKEEVTYGTDPVPAAATDAIRVNPIWNGLRVRHAFPQRRDDIASGSLVPGAPTVRRGRFVELELALELRGAGTAYSASNLPEADPLLKACGLGLTLVVTPGTESASYGKADTGHKSCTIYGWSGSKLFKVVGCRGTVRWALTAGGITMLIFNMQGIMVADPTEVALPSATYDSALPPAAVGMTITLGGWAPEKVFSSEWALQADVQRFDTARGAGANADGIGEFAIRMLNPRYRLDVPSEALSAFDPYDQMRDATALTLAQSIGSVQYNKIALDSTETYLEEVEHPEQNGFTGWGLICQQRAFTLKYD